MIRYFSLLFCIGFSYLFGQNTSITALQQTITSMAGTSTFAHGKLGVAVLDADDYSLLAGTNEEMTMIPASTLKLITTATALQRLGADHRFETAIYTSGKLNGKTLEGDLIILGGGDPALGSDRFEHYKNWEEKVIDALKKKGINSIEGNIIADNSYFQGTPTPPGWTWEDMGNYYGSGVFGLNVMDNTYHIIFESGPSPGDKTTIKGTDPDIPGISFTNDVTSGARNGDNAYVYGAPFSNEVYVTGTITRGQSAFKRTKGCIPNPPLFIAQLLKKELESSSVAVKGKATYSVTPVPLTDADKIYTITSPALEEIVAETNAESVNLYAETLLLQALYEKGSFSSLDAAKKLTSYWESRGIDTDGLALYDGSGLTRKNGITPKQMALIAAKSLKVDSTFYQNLPCAGKEGTVKYMCQNTAAEGAVWMKSGTLDRVRNYAGYAKTKSGQWVTFAIFSNDYSGSSSALKEQVEVILEKIASLEF